MKQAISKGLWAPIFVPKHGGVPWVNHLCIRYTRREAKAAYLDGFAPEQHREELKLVRFARVDVMEVVKP